MARTKVSFAKQLAERYPAVYLHIDPDTKEVIGVYYDLDDLSSMVNAGAYVVTLTYESAGTLEISTTINPL